GYVHSLALPSFPTRRSSDLAIPLVNPSVVISGSRLRDARFIAALLCQHSPGDPRQLVSKGRRQNVRMQAMRGANKPSPEAVLWRSEEHTSELQSHLNLVCRL